MGNVIGLYIYVRVGVGVSLAFVIVVVDTGGSGDSKPSGHGADARVVCFGMASSMGVLYIGACILYGIGSFWTLANGIRKRSCRSRSCDRHGF
jgi:hypothetical protein